MDTNTMLEMLKVDLGISTTAYDVRLLQYLDSAQTAIEIEGITLDPESIADGNLVVTYAAWLWRRRDFSFQNTNESRAGMPRMLRWLLNNRLFSEKVELDG